MGDLVPRRAPRCISSCLLRAHSSIMKGSRAVSTPSGPPEGNPEGVDLSLTGLPPPLFRRPNSASAAKPIARSVSVVAGSEPRRKALVSAGAPGRGVSGPPTSWGVAGRVASDSWVSAAPRQAPHSCHPAQPCGPVQPCGCPEVGKDRGANSQEGRAEPGPASVTPSVLPAPPPFALVWIQNGLACGGGPSPWRPRRNRPQAAVGCGAQAPWSVDSAEDTQLLLQFLAGPHALPLGPSASRGRGASTSLQEGEARGGRGRSGCSCRRPSRHTHLLPPRPLCGAWPGAV